MAGEGRHDGTVGAGPAGQEQPSPVAPRPVVPPWRSTLAVLALVVLAVGMAQTNAGHALLRKAGLFGQPASYTSLAFQHPQSLPQKFTSAQADVPVSFVVGNAGHAPRTYRWTVSLVEGSRTRPVATGSVRVAPGHRAVLTRIAPVACTQRQVRLVVSLVDPAESIHDLATCPPTPTSSP